MKRSLWQHLHDPMSVSTCCHLPAQYLPEPRQRPIQFPTSVRGKIRVRQLLLHQARASRAPKAEEKVNRNAKAGAPTSRRNWLAKPWKHQTAAAFVGHIICKMDARMPRLAASASAGRMSVLSQVAVSHTACPTTRALEAKRRTPFPQHLPLSKHCCQPSV